MQENKKLKLIQDYIAKMPSLPVTVSKILEICNDPKTSPIDLNKVISVDPVLMGRVMKLINSAYYGISQEITSLVRAIIMLGINTVKNLALSTAVMGAIGKSNKSQTLDMEAFWRHSLCVGVTAKLIAKQCGVDSKHIEEYFVAGLLHDVGKIPINNRLPEDLLKSLVCSDREKIALYEAEKREMNTNHIEIGCMIIKFWKLGQDIHDTVLYHHYPSEYDGPHKQIVNIVALANFFANRNEIGFAGDRYPIKVEPEILNNKQINWDFLDSIEDKVNSEINKAKIFLKLAS